MTLINSCCPKSFSHLIFLLMTFTITATTIPADHIYQLDASKHDTTGGSAAVIGYDRKNDNKRFDNLFDFKTDVNNLLFRAHGNLRTSTITRQKRDIKVSSLETSSDSSNSRNSTTPPTTMVATSLPTENIILNLSFANLTSLSVNFSTVISDSVMLLNLSHNLLSHFNSSKLTKLKALDLSHNILNEYNLRGHKCLQSLDVSANSLTAFNCVDCESLQTLKLSHNKIANITLDNVSKLTFVDLSANELTEIDPNLFHNKSNLSDVILACNRIRVINKDLFRQLLSLRRLDLSYNDISDIESETFSNLLNLQVFDLSFNRIHIASLQSLQSIADLARLSLAGNVLLRNALRGFAVTWSIMELDYSHVGLCQVPDSLAQSVRILNLYGNFVNTICSGDFDSYPLLHKLVLSNNNLTSIEDDALGRLETLTILHLDNNQLTQIPASLPSSLIKLYMNDNRITDIKPDDLINLINLEVLDVSCNKIIYMPQIVLPALITLSVKSSELENIHREISKTCPSLRHLLIDGNLIKCSELMGIEQCNENSEALTNEYINDNIDYNQDDVERKEGHLNSISYFPNDGGWKKCGREGRGSVEGAMPKTLKEIVPNCWNEQKLITSFILTNDSTPTATTMSPPSSTTAASNDNKFEQQSSHNVTKGSSKGKNDGNLSNETMKINNNTTMEEKITVQGSTAQAKPHNWQSGMPAKSEKMKNSKATVDERKLMKKAKLALPVNVVKMEIKALNNDGNSTGVDKNLSLGSYDAHRQKGLNNSVLMKTKQIKSTDANSTIATSSSTMIAKIENPGVRSNNIIINNTTANPYSSHEASGAANQTGTIINRNLIDYVNGDYRRAQSLSKFISANKIKAIKDNESLNSTNNSKSIDEVQSKDNKSRGGHNSSVNGRPLAIEMLPGGNNGGNESIDATDHQQHTAINQTMNGEQSEQWNDIRSETINHPGLLIVITVSVGVLFTFIVVYVYRCNFISSARRHRRRGSCETINEGRDVLNDNFNEETHSFTIETHNHCTSPLTAMPTLVNQCDLLPMDILNSTLNQSADRSHISMHLW